MSLKIPVIIFTLVMAGGFGSHAAAQSAAPQLSTEEANTLVWMREEEKLARDTYITLYERWGARVFNNISRSEQKHMDALLVLLTAYGISDPVTDDTVGVFNDPVLGELYDKLIADGYVSSLDALYVGAYIEELDIKDLWEAIDGSTHADVTAAYENLLAGSYKHLNAFVGQIEQSGIDYQAQVLKQSEVDKILGQSTAMTAEMSDGSWIVSGHSGEGMVIDVTIDGLLVLYWMTYDNQGKQMWLLGLTDQTSGADIHLTLKRFSGPVFGPGFDTNDLERETWGEADIHFRDCAFADVSYRSDTGFGTGQLEIERIYYAAGSLCQPE